MNYFCCFEIFLLLLHPKAIGRPEAPFFAKSCTKIRAGLILCQNDLQQQTEAWLQPYLLPFQHHDSCGISSPSRTMWAEEVYTWGINRHRRWMEDPTCKRSNLGENWCSKTLLVTFFFFFFNLPLSPSVNIQCLKWDKGLNHQLGFNLQDFIRALVRAHYQIHKIHQRSSS